MVYKTRKTNKRRNFKRRYSRKIYVGGQNQQINNVSQVSNNGSADDIAGEKIMEKIKQQNELEFPSIEEVPIVGPVLEKTGDLIEGASVKGLNIMANSIGVDLNNPGSINKKLDELNQSFSDPENVEKLKEVASNAGQYASVVVQASKPAIKEFVEGSGPILVKGVNDAVKAGVTTGVNLLDDVAGPIFGLPRTLLSVARAFNASVNAGSEFIKSASETVQGTMENYDRLKNNMKMPNVKMPNVKMPNMKMPNVKMPNMNMPNVKMPNVKMPNMKMPNVKMPNMNMPNMNANSSLKQMQNEAIKVGGRIHKSQLDFLKPRISSEKILKQYGGKWNTGKWNTGKWNTKKHYKKHYKNIHKMTSHRR
jgi:hypothetical protein